MESSTVLAFRIFVMLSCLIIVPMAAIFGSQFPDVVKSVLIDRIVEWSTGKTQETTRGADEGPFGKVVPQAGNDAPNVRSDSEAPRWGTQASATTWQGQPTGPQAPEVIPAAATLRDPAAGNQPANFVAAADPNPAFRQPEQGVSPGNAPGYAQPQPGGSGMRQPFAHGADPTAAAGRAAQSLEQPDRFTAMERKLREYGATYYLLETWGNEGELYRFHCKMAIGNNPHYTRHFEATDRDALRAMNQVLERVESWRAGRQQ